MDQLPCGSSRSSAAWAQREQRLVQLDRVRRGVHDGEDPGERPRVAFGDQPGAARGGGPGRASGVVGAQRVVLGQAAVQADADADGVPGQDGQPPFGEQGGVGLDGGVHGAAARYPVAYEIGEPGEGVHARQQGFTAVQDQGQGRRAVGAGVFADPERGPFQDFGRCGGGTGAPGVVGALVEVAVAAGEVAAAVHLDDELAEGERRSADRRGGRGGRRTRGARGGRLSRHSGTPMTYGSAAPTADRATAPCPYRATFPDADRPQTPPARSCPVQSRAGT